MKKYLMLILSAIMILTVLISCTDQSDNGASTTQSTTVPSDPVTGTTATTQPTVTPPEDQPEIPTDPTNPVYTVTWQFTYDYGFHHEGEATLLVNYGYLQGDFNWIRIPNDIVAGDAITINYTGDYVVQETYPSSIILNGEVISYSFTYANVIPMATENLTEEMLLEYDAPNNYVILDRSGKYTTLDKYEGDRVYLVEDQRTVRPRTEDTPFYVSCMLAYNPRDLEDGVPENENISEIEAREIAHDHYYNRYFVKYEEQLEYEIVEAKSLDGYWQVHITEYWEGGCGYYYTIDKITGEIVSMVIAE